jgi:[ribosomal protein S5]-alanine N-acetyltransferase
VNVIRPAAPADAQAIFELRLANRAQLEPYEPDTEDSETRWQLEGARRWVTAGPGKFVIIDDDGTVVGGLGLFDIRGTPLSSAILGYWVDRARNGRGLATRAVAEVLDIAFAEFGLHRLEAGTRVDNVASQRVLERNGFTCVGLLRRHLLIQGEWHDHLLWERLADD